MKDWRDAGKEERKNAGEEACRKLESMNAEKEGFRTVWMQDRKHA